VIQKARVKPSDRGEWRITTLNQMYLEEGRSERVELVGPWLRLLDLPVTHESLLEASFLYEIIEKRQGLKVDVLERLPLKWAI